MEIFHATFFDSSLMIMTTIQILFMKYKQKIVVDYLKKSFQLLIRSSISLMAVLNNVIAKTLLICVIISKISVWMLNGYSLELVVMASHQVMVLGNLLLCCKTQFTKTPTWAYLELPINVDLCVGGIPSITFFGVSQEKMVDVHARGLLYKVKDLASNKE